jgi:hypothetical protein
MRLLVYGGRDYSDRETFALEIASALNWVPAEDDINTWLPPNGTTIISGGARGADQMAIDWAVVHWTGLEVYQAKWALHGRAAGPIRNQQMIDKGKPDKGLAFPGGSGTADMTRRLKAAGIPIIEVTA